MISTTTQFYDELVSNLVVTILELRGKFNVRKDSFEFSVPGQVHCFPGFGLLCFSRIPGRLILFAWIDTGYQCLYEARQFEQPEAVIGC